MLWTGLITSIFVVILHIFKPNGSSLLENIIVFNLILIPITVLFIGLRPILGLRTSVDTLYVSDNKLILGKSEIIKIENIDSVEVHQIGAAESHLLYYEIILKKPPTILKIKDRKSLVAVEPYNIRHILQTRLDVLRHLTRLGLSEDKIQWNEMKTKHILGFREKFKK